MVPSPQGQLTTMEDSASRDQSYAVSRNSCDINTQTQVPNTQGPGRLTNIGIVEPTQTVMDNYQMPAANHVLTLGIQDHEDEPCGGDDTTGTDGISITQLIMSWYNGQTNDPRTNNALLMHMAAFATSRALMEQLRMIGFGTPGKCIPKFFISSMRFMK